MVGCMSPVPMPQRTPTGSQRTTAFRLSTVAGVDHGSAQHCPSAGRHGVRPQPKFLPRPWPHSPRVLGGDPLSAGPRELISIVVRHLRAPEVHAEIAQTLREEFHDIARQARDETRPSGE